ncbi:hypothetical protein ACKWTF_010846 [Chironomus riparius]
MVRKSAYGVFLIFIILINNGYAEEKEEVKDEKPKSDDKTVSKRGILHFGIHGHPHVHGVPFVPKIPVITKVPTFIKPAVLPAPVIPTTPYHLTHGGATVTSYNANYPRVPIYTKTVIPPAYPFLPAIPHNHHHGLIPHSHHHGLIPHSHHLGFDLHHGYDHHHLAGLFPHNHHHHHLAGLFPHNHHHHSLYPHHHHSLYPHHHHSLYPHHHNPAYPHVHISKPIVPVAVPVPEYHHHKIPVFYPSKPVFSKPEFNPTFVPIPVPSNPQPNPTVITVNPGISSSTNHNINHINLYPKTQQTPIQPIQNHHHQNSQGNWQPILKPTQATITDNCTPYNYHAALKSSSSSTSNNSVQTNNFVSGQGPSMAQQFAHYQQQQYLHDQHNSYPYPAAAETFSQNYEAPSNNGNYHGLSSYQVPLGVQ